MNQIVMPPLAFYRLRLHGEEPYHYPWWQFPYRLIRYQWMRWRYKPRLNADQRLKRGGLAVRLRQYPQTEFFIT